MKKLLAVAAIGLTLSSCMSLMFPVASVALGERIVRFRGDHDEIAVGDSDGAWRSLLFTTDRNDIEVYNIVVVYGNGERERIPSHLFFRDGSRSRVVDFHGDRRRIRTIQFDYRSVGKWPDERARVAVSGVR